MASIENKCLALAGMVQACLEVRKIATQGVSEQDVLIVAVKSILNMNPENTIDVFGSVNNLRQGLNVIKSYSFDQKTHDLELTKMIMMSLTLSRKLMARNDYLTIIEKKIESIQEQVEFFDLEHANVTASIAGLYQETISHLNPRIMIKGDAAHLEPSNNANKIRTYLLSAIRCGVLWHQLGGSRWQILFQRNKYIATADKLLRQSTH